MTDHNTIDSDKLKNLDLDVWDDDIRKSNTNNIIRSSDEHINKKDIFDDALNYHETYNKSEPTVSDIKNKSDIEIKQHKPQISNQQNKSKNKIGQISVQQNKSKNKNKQLNKQIPKKQEQNVYDDLECDYYDYHMHDI